MNEPIRHIRYGVGLAVPITSILLLCFSMVAHGQPAVKITDSVDQHMFTSNEIQYLEDKEGKYNIKDVLNPEIGRQFVAGRTNTPQNYNLKSAYWYRIKIRHQPDSHKNWILEFFDQTIDDITVYSPDGKGNYLERKMGDRYPFRERGYIHKNFEIDIQNDAAYDGTYYFRVHSHQTADAIVVLRSLNRFIQYALDEYFILAYFMEWCLFLAFII